MSTFLLALLVKFKGIIAGVASGFIAAILLVLSLRSKKTDYTVANTINKEANDVSKTTQATTEVKQNENDAKTASNIVNLHNADSLRKQREIAAKAVSDAND